MNDTDLIKVIRRFVSTEEKPIDLTPLDLLQVIRLLVQQADEKDCYLSQETLAIQLCSSADAIKRSQDRLRKRDWLIVRKGGYRGRSNKYEVVLDQLPLADLTRTLVTPRATRMATSYGMVTKVASRKKFMKGWLQQWSFTIQRLIDRTGDSELVANTINFALHHPIYAKRAMEGPSKLRPVWTKLLAEYKATGATQLREAATVEEHALPVPNNTESQRV